MNATTDLSLLRRWIAARVRLTLRAPRAVAFTFVMPLLFVVLFNALNSGTRVDALVGRLGDVPFAQFYTPSMGVLGLVIACYTTLVIGMSTARDTGLLKRVRGTPLPMPIYLASYMSGQALIGFAAVLLMFVVAVPAYGVHIYPETLPAAIVTLAIGAFMLTSLGLMVASLVRDADQATPVAQLTFLPMSFLSGLFFPIGGAPDWLISIAKVFPLYHLAQAFNGCFVPGVEHAGWALGDLAVVALWGVVALRIAARRFAVANEENGPGLLRARLGLLRSPRG